MPKISEKWRANSFAIVSAPQRLMTADSLKWVSAHAGAVALMPLQVPFDSSVRQQSYGREHHRIQIPNADPIRETLYDGCRRSYSTRSLA